MFQKFYPTVYALSAYEVDFKALYHKGYRGLLTDVDNTLVEHGASSNEKAEAFFKMLHDMGWKTCIISNNDEARVQPFAQACESLYIAKAGKPLTTGYRQGMQIMNTDLTNTVFMGDQLFTDILGANQTGLRSILVKPVKIDRKPFILLKRAGEVIVKWFYFRYASAHPSEL